jgi:hypothetical protein
VLRDRDAIIIIKGIIFYRLEIQRVLDVQGLAGIYISSTSLCNERVDRGDDQRNRNFIIEGKNYFE